jgi:hypothetical protein
LRLPSAVGAAERSASEVAFALGENDNAQHFAATAMTAFEQAGAILDADRARLLLGRILAASGQRADAIEHLDAAAARFDELAAHGYRDAAEQQLRKLAIAGTGGQHRHRTTAPPSQHLPAANVR